MTQATVAEEWNPPPPGPAAPASLQKWWGTSGNQLRTNCPQNGKKTPNPTPKPVKPPVHCNPNPQLSCHVGAAGRRKKGSWQEAGALLCSSASSAPAQDLAPEVRAINAPPHVAPRSNRFFKVADRWLILAHKARMFYLWWQESCAVRSPHK